MKKQILFPLLTMVLLMAAGSANAQLGANEVRAKIPFDYKVGNATMKSGDCSIRTAGDNALVIRSSGSEAALTLSRSVYGKPSRDTKLVFSKYGDEYFLAQIWVEGETSGVQLPKTRAERELMSKTTPEPVIILAKK